MFDVGDLPVGLLAFGNCVSLFKTGVTKWPLKLHVRFLTFYVFFKIQKNTTLRFFELLHTFFRTLASALSARACGARSRRRRRRRCRGCCCYDVTAVMTS